MPRTVSPVPAEPPSVRGVEDCRPCPAAGTAGPIPPAALAARALLVLALIGVSVGMGASLTVLRGHLVDYVSANRLEPWARNLIGTAMLSGAAASVGVGAVYLWQRRDVAGLHRA